jgi:FMN-dependent NADH-azoreductase
MDSSKDLKTADKTKYNKKYYETHKDKLKEMALKKVKCPHCDKEYSQANWNKHIKSDKHKTKERLSHMSDNNILNELKQLRDKVDALST